LKKRSINEGEVEAIIAIDRAVNVCVIASSDVVAVVLLK